MKKFSIFFLLLAAPLWALKVDPKVHTFDNHVKTEKIDRFEFGGLYPQLDRVNIDAHRKKYVELEMTGEFPVLKSIIFDGSFGRLDANLTGSFPVLADVDVKVTSNKVTLDLRADWKQDCSIIVTGTSADITVKLPKAVGLNVRTKKGVKGKVKGTDFLKKHGLFNKKRFVANPDADVVLDIYIEVTDGQITLQ